MPEPNYAEMVSELAQLIGVPPGVNIMAAAQVLVRRSRTERDRFREALESAQTLIETGSPQLALVTIQAALLPE